MKANLKELVIFLTLGSCVLAVILGACFLAAFTLPPALGFVAITVILLMSMYLIPRISESKMFAGAFN